MHRRPGAGGAAIVDEVALLQLQHQNPGFGQHLMGLVSGRLSQDVRRVEQRLAELSARMPSQG